MPLIICFRAECSSEISETMPGDLSSYASEAKGYNEFVKAQVEMAKEASERMMEEVRTNMSLANEVRDEYRAWAQAGMSEMTAEIKKSVASAS